MDDLVERLRGRAWRPMDPEVSALLSRAADRIEALQARIAELEAIMKVKNDE